jgi:membrane-bound lytic murein transglycosylase B
MVRLHKVDEKALTALLQGVKLREDILRAIARPAESKPWYEYRPILLTEERIQAGVQFWNTHAATLARAETVYGVPPETIVAILGVETAYGRRQGRHKVLEALATLAFHYPPRSEFFTKELEQFLLLAQEEDFTPGEVEGSYAGAMGIPQFISSSYRHYAVDFDRDGRRDLFASAADAIGSVASYFVAHGWRGQTPIASPVQVEGEGFRSLQGDALEPKHTIAEWRAAGVRANPALPDDTLATLIDLETHTGHEYWLGLHNFYVITRYNHSALYAMAVYQLGRTILGRHRQRNARL